MQVLVLILVVHSTIMALGPGFVKGDKILRL
jgi:hypothetical protein